MAPRIFKLTVKPFPFQKLPPELRELVYEEVFLRKRVRVRNTMKKGELPVGERRWKITANAVVDNKDGTEYQKIRFLGKQGASLLRISREISKEATSVLYGKNEFEFTSLFGFSNFVDVIGDSSKLIRDVRLSCSLRVSPGLAHALELLGGFERLRHLVLPIAEEFIPWSSGSKRYDAFLKDIILFIKASTFEGSPRKVWDKIQFYSSGSWRSMFPPGVARTQWSKDEAPQKMKDAIAQILRIDVCLKIPKGWTVSSR